MVNFENERQENINKRKAEALEKEKNKNIEGQGKESWAKVNENIDLKEGDYKGTKNVDRMREAMLNRKNEPNSSGEAKTFFG